MKKEAIVHDEDGIQVIAVLDEDGNEHGDPFPLAPPVGVTRPVPLHEQIRQMIRREYSEAAHNQGFETFEEAEDFDIDDDPLDPHTPYEAVFDPPPPTMEAKDGDKGRDKRGSDLAGGGSGKSGKVGKGKSGEKQPAVDKGSPSETDDGDTSSESED